MVDYSAVTIEFGATPTEKTLLELVKDLMGIGSGDTSRDSELTMYLQMAGEAAEDYTNNTIAKKEVTEEISRSRSPVLLRHFPFDDSVTPVVVVDGDDVSSDYEVMLEGSLGWLMSSRSGRSESCAFKQMTITYTAGHNPLPAQLGYAIARTAMAFEQQAGGVGAVRKEVVAGVGSVEYETSSTEQGGEGMFSAAAISILDKYRVHAF